MEFLCFVCTLLLLAFWFGEKFLRVFGGNFFLAFLVITLITLFCTLVSVFAWEWIRAHRGRICLLIVSGTLCFSVAACSKSYPVYETEIVTIAPPAYLLEPFQVPFFTGDTNEDLLLYTLNMRQSLQLCNTRLEAVKKSVEVQKQNFVSE